VRTARTGSRNSAVSASRGFAAGAVSRLSAAAVRTSASSSRVAEMRWSMPSALSARSAASALARTIAGRFVSASS
jgi:hypothetical protein